MSITLDVKALRAAAAECAAVAEGGSTAPPVLANVLIEEGKGGDIRFSATDLDTVIERHVSAVQGELAREPLKTTVSARFLAAIAAKLDDGAQATLSWEEGAGRILLSSGRARFTLPTLPAEDFPVFADEEWAAEFELKPGALAALIDRVSFAVSTDETRYYLHGLYLHAVEDPDAGPLLRAAATDGHRLARTQLPLPAGAETLPKAGVIVPKRSLGLIRKLIDHMPPAAEGEDRKVAVAVRDNRIRLDFGGTVLTSKLIDGTFPDYTRVIPTANQLLLTVDKETLREAAERVSVIVSERTRALKVETDADRVTLTVTSPESGTAIEELPADYGAEPLTIGFNVKYLLDVLTRIEGKEVRLALGDSAGPALITEVPASAEAPPESLYVLMPLRV